MLRAGIPRWNGGPVVHVWLELRVYFGRDLRTWLGTSRPERAVKWLYGGVRGRVRGLVSAIKTAPIVR